MRLANVLNLAGKELRGLARDRFLLGLIFYAFTVMVYASATALPDTLNRAPIAIVDEDRSPLSERIVSAFTLPYFSPPQLIDQAEMDRRMDAGRDTFALDIPPDFERDLLAGRKPTIQLNVDATRMMQAFSGSGYVQSIVTGEVTGFAARRPATATPAVTLVTRARFNPELNRQWFGGIIEIIDDVTLLAIVLTGAALIREREHGTIEHLLVMPVTPLEIMVSKILAMGLVVLVSAWLSLLVVAQGFLGVVISGPVWLFMLGAALHLFATTSLGITLATIAGTMPQFGLLLMLVLLPMQVLSGGLTPRESMPQIVRWIMEVAPNTHFVILAQAILFRGAGLDVVWPQFLALLAIGGALFGFSLGRFRRFLR